MKPFWLRVAVGLIATVLLIAIIAFAMGWSERHPRVVLYGALGLVAFLVLVMGVLISWLIGGGILNWAAKKWAWVRKFYEPDGC